MKNILTAEQQNILSVDDDISGKSKQAFLVSTTLFYSLLVNSIHICLLHLYL